MLQTQEGPDGETNVGGEFLPAGTGQLQVTADPVCHGAVWCQGPEHPHKAISAQMNLPPLRRDLRVPDRHTAVAVQFDLAVGLEPGQPGETQAARMAPL